MFRRSMLVLAVTALLAGCGESPPEAAAPAPAAATADAAGFDHSGCRIPGLVLPVPGKLFVVDGGAPAPDAEPGRESIRRVEVLVPGPVVLLLTAPDATAWHVLVSPETQLQAVVASGGQSQRITGQGLGPARLQLSEAMGDPCGRYWLRDGAGTALDGVTRAAFGRPHDAIYRMRTGLVVIGGPDSTAPESIAPRR
jgi:hypothetical protein